MKERKKQTKKERKKERKKTKKEEKKAINETDSGRETNKFENPNGKQF